MFTDSVKTGSFAKTTHREEQAFLSCRFSLTRFSWPHFSSPSSDSRRRRLLSAEGAVGAPYTRSSAWRTLILQVHFITESS